MSLELAIQENTLAVRALIDALTGANTLPEVKSEKLKTEVKEEKPKAEAKAETKVEPKEEAPVEEKAPVVAYDQVKQAVVELVTSKGRDAVVAVLSKFNVSTAKDLPETEWAPCLKALTEAQEA